MRSGFYLGLTLPLLLAMAVNAYGLTTFGKSQTVNQPTNQQPAQKGRECVYEKDCGGISNTSCVPDPLEPKTTRCLCGDNNTPKNGACKAKFKGVNHECKANEDCMEGSECMPYKDGGNRGVEKTCKCSEGYIEVDFSCSGGSRLTELSFPIYIAASLTLLVAVFTSTY